jgi:hypothetical protein
MGARRNRSGLDFRLSGGSSTSSVSSDECAAHTGALNDMAGMMRECVSRCAVIVSNVVECEEQVLVLVERVE